jgi:hypothetical protein
VLQVEADMIDGNNEKKREILFAMAPTLGELADAVEKVSYDLDATAFNEEAFKSKFAEPLPTLLSESFFQDSFGPIVLVAASQICIDLYYMALFFFVMLAPWRFYELMCSLMQSDEQYFLRVARHAMKLKREGDRYLAEFREKFIPVLNSFTKSVVQYESAMSVSYVRIEALDAFESSTFGRYSASYLKILKRFKTLDGRGAAIGLDQIETEIRDLVFIQCRRLAVWPLRFALVARGNRHAAPQNLAAAGEILLRIDREESNKQTSKDINIQNIFSEIEKKYGGSNKISLKNWSSRPIDDSRWIIKDIARATLADYGIIVVFIVLVVSIAPLPALISDLWTHRNSPSHSVREIVICHARKFIEMKTKLGMLFLYSIVICFLVVGVPAYVEKLPRCDTIDDCIHLAKETLR